MLQLSESKVNMISDEYRESIPKLVGTKVFQMLNGIPNGDPDLTERQKQPILYGHCQIPTQDRIKDPKTGHTVIIGVVEDFEPKTGVVTKWKLFVPGMAERKFWGKFSLIEGNLADEEMYEYLQICNYNRDNPNRNKKIEPMFYEIKQGAEKEFKPLPKMVTTAGSPTLDALDAEQKAKNKGNKVEQPALV